MELLKKEVRSLLMAAKEGLTPAQLEEEYMAMIGKPLPLHDLGFQSTLELVADMPEVVRVCPYEKGTFILKGEGFFSLWVEELFRTTYWYEVMLQDGDVQGEFPEL